MKQPLSDSQRKLTGLRSKTVKKISELVAEFFKNERIRYGWTKGGCFRADFKGYCGVFSVLIVADDENHLLGAFTICPLTIAKAKLSAVTELIARINCTLTMGNFDIDLEDGTILARMAIKLGDIELDSDTLKGIIFGAWLTMDYFFPAIVSIVFTNISPRQALAELESNWHRTIRRSKSRRDKLPPSEGFNRWIGCFSNN